MKKVSTVGAKQSKNFSQPTLTIGLDLEDRNSWYCMLDEAGQIQTRADRLDPQGLFNAGCPFRDIGNRTFRRHGLHFSARRGRRGDAMEGAFCYLCLRNGEALLWWRRLDSNQRPTDYETVALTT